MTFTVYWALKPIIYLSIHLLLVVEGVAREKERKNSQRLWLSQWAFDMFALKAPRKGARTAFRGFNGLVHWLNFQFQRHPTLVVVPARFQQKQSICSQEMTDAKKLICSQGMKDIYHHGLKTLHSLPDQSIPHGHGSIS